MTRSDPVVRKVKRLRKHAPPGNNLRQPKQMEGVHKEGDTASIDSDTDREKVKKDRLQKRLDRRRGLLNSNYILNEAEIDSDEDMDGDAAEHIREAIPVLSQYVDALGVRVFAEGRDLEEDLSEPFFSTVQELCPVPLVNMESAIDHPCQALADWKTLDDLDVPRAGGKFVLSWANHPRALPLAVPSAAVRMAAMRGMDVTVLRPEGFGLPEPILDRARAAAAKSGGSVRETDNREEALEGAQVLYAKSWGAPAWYGDAEAEREVRSSLGDWCVGEDWFAPADPSCRFLHCLPVRRNVVVRDEVLDGPRSAVIRQARNRMWAQMAVLHRMLRGTAPETEGWS